MSKKNENEDDFKIVIKSEPPKLEKSGYYPTFGNRVVSTEVEVKKQVQPQKKVKPIPTIQSSKNRVVKTQSQTTTDDSDSFFVSTGSKDGVVDRRPSRVESEKEGIEKGRIDQNGGNEDEKSWFEFEYKEEEDPEMLEKLSKASPEEKKSVLKKKKEKPVEKRKYSNVKKEKKEAEVLQKYTASFLAKKKMKKLEKNKTKRMNLCKELLDTEKGYIHNLKVAKEVYVDPLKALAGKKTSFKLSDFNRVFTSSFSNILQLNSVLCKDLEKVMFKNGVYQHHALISKHLLRITPFLKMYRSYCSNFGNALATLKKLRKKDSEFSALLSKMDHNSKTNKLGINSYLSLPITRIPRYRLLLQGILKCTEEEHPDYKGIATALSVIKEVADFLDKSVEELNESKKLIDLQNKFIGKNKIEIQQPHRIYVCHYNAFLKSVNNTIPVHVHLLNDIVMFSKEVKGEDNLKNLCVIELAKSTLLESRNKKFSNCFKILGVNTNLIIDCGSLESKKNIIYGIGRQMRKLKEGGEGITHYDQSTSGVASQINFTMTEEECVAYVKSHSTRMVIFSAKPHIKFFSLSRNESQLMWSETKGNIKKGKKEVLNLFGNNIFAMTKETIIPNKQETYLSFKILHGNGQKTDKGWTGKTLKLICGSIVDYLIWTNALKLVLMDQGKNAHLRNKKVYNNVDLEKKALMSERNVGNNIYFFGKDSGNLSSSSMRRKKDSFLPKCVRDFLYLSVFSVECGDDARFVVLTDGSVFSYGKGESGKLGHGDIVDYSKPTLVKALVGHKIIQVSQGEKHVMFLEDNGSVWVNGMNESGQLGLGKSFSKIQKISMIVKGLRGCKIVFINAGSRHSSAVSEKGELYIWGSGQEGQNGLGNRSDVFVPTLVDLKTKEKVVSTALGCAHSLVLTEDGNIYCFGDGSYGQMGLGKKGKDHFVLKPQLLNNTFLKGKVRMIAAGAFHCCAVTQAGKIFCWGNGLFGQLGNGSKKSSVATPVLLTKLVESHCSKIVCGTNHVIALVSSGGKFRVVAWGAGTFGRLGLSKEKENDQPTPKFVEFMDDKPVVSIFAGGCMSACITKSHKIPEKDVLHCMNESCSKTLGKKKNRCGYCQGLYCGICVQKKIRIGLDVENQQKVCDVCFDIVKLKYEK